MRVLGLTLAACIVLCLSAARAADKKNAEKIIGTWEATRGEIPPGSTIAFTKDGKLKMTVKVEGKTISVEGIYKMQDDAIKITTRQDGKDKTENVKIKTLTGTKLVTVNEKGEVDEFKRK